MVAKISKTEAANKDATDTPSGIPANNTDIIVPPKIAQVALTDVDRIKPIRFTTVKCICMAIPKTIPQPKMASVSPGLLLISAKMPDGIICFPRRPIAAHTMITDIPYIILINAWTGKFPRCFTV